LCAARRQLGIQMPIAEAVAGIVSGDIDVDTAIRALLSRPLEGEHSDLHAFCPDLHRQAACRRLADGESRPRHLAYIEASRSAVRSWPDHSAPMTGRP
jgi:hypothetical protein